MNNSQIKHANRIPLIKKKGEKKEEIPLQKYVLS